MAFTGRAGALTGLGSPSGEASDERASKRGLYQGLDDANVRAIQLVVTPLLMALLGVYLDGKFGSGPFLAIGLGVMGLFGECVRAYVAYKAKMLKAEEGKPWAKN